MHQAIEPAVWMHAPNSAARVVKAGGSLISKQDRAIWMQRKIVRSFETFGQKRAQLWRNLSSRRVDSHDAVAIIGNDEVAVRKHLHPIRPAIILSDQFPTRAVNLEDAAVGNIDYVKPALRVETGAFESRVDGNAATIDIAPLVAFGPTKLLRQVGHDLGR